MQQQKEILYGLHMGINIYKVWPFYGSEEYHFKALGCHFDTEEEAREAIRKWKEKNFKGLSVH